MRAAVISLGSISSRLISDELKRYFDVDQLDLRDVHIDHPRAHYKGARMKDYDMVYVRGSFRFGPILRGLSSVFKESYTPVNYHDTLSIHLKLKEAGIPQPKSYIVTAQTGKKLLAKTKVPMIMKTASGRKGLLANRKNILTFSQLNQPFLLQEQIGATNRSIVIGNKSYGFEGKLPVWAAKAVGADVCAVDTVNGRVASVDLYPSIQSNLSGKIAKFLYDQSKAFIQ